MWARDIAGDLFSSRLLSRTEMLILDDINFSVASICTTELIEYSLAEMKRCSLAAPPARKIKADYSPTKNLSKTAFPRLSALDPSVNIAFESLQDIDNLLVR